MGFEDVKEIIDFAIDKEKEAAEFYEQVSREESMSGAKEMFLEFAAEEKKHQTLLENVGKKGVGEVLDAYKFKWVVDLKRSDFVVDLDYTPGMAYNEILMLAMKREEKALELYNQFLKNASGDEQQKLFKMLCQEEAKHKLKLETLYDDYMAEMGD